MAKIQVINITDSVIKIHVDDKGTVSSLKAKEIVSMEEAFFESLKKKSAGNYIARASDHLQGSFHLQAEQIKDIEKAKIEADKKVADLEKQVTDLEKQLSEAKKQPQK